MAPVDTPELNPDVHSATRAEGRPTDVITSDFSLEELSRPAGCILVLVPNWEEEDDLSL